MNKVFDLSENTFQVIYSSYFWNWSTIFIFLDLCCSGMGRKTNKSPQHIATRGSCRLSDIVPFSSLLTRVWKLLMMPMHCLSGALFCSPKNNIQRIVWTFCFCFNASEDCWTVLAACANSYSNDVSLLAYLSCTLLLLSLTCRRMCACVFQPQRTQRHLWCSYHTCSIHEKKPSDFAEGSLRI